MAVHRLHYPVNGSCFPERVQRLHCCCYWWRRSHPPRSKHYPFPPYQKEQLIVCSIITVIICIQAVYRGLLHHSQVVLDASQSAYSLFPCIQKRILTWWWVWAWRNWYSYFVITVTASIFQLKVSRSGDIRGFWYEETICIKTRIFFRTAPCISSVNG